MAPKKYNMINPLKRLIGVRLSTADFKRLEELKQQSNCHTLSEFARKIILREKVIWYHKDASLDATAAELAGIRKELKAIGININQVTRYFHSKALPDQKIYEALKLLDDYKKVGDKVDKLLALITELSLKWSPK